MRLLQILLMGLLFAAGEVMLPLVPVAEAAAEEMAEETSHPSARRRARHVPATAGAGLPRVHAVSAVSRPITGATPAHVEPGQRSTHRKIPPPARSSSASPEDH